MTRTDRAHRGGEPMTTLGLLAAVALASGLVAWLVALAGWARAELVLPPLIGALLLGAATASRRLRPVLLVLGATVVGLWLIAVGLALVAEPTGDWPLACRILLAAAAKIVPVVLVLAVLVRYVRDRAAADLRVGNWRAPSGIRVAGRDVDWRWVGGLVAVLVGGGTLASGAPDMTAAGIRAALLWLPVLVAAAAVNSTAEELLFRHAVNATTRDLVRPAVRIALTSTYFGLAHIHGNPSGVAGILLSGAFGVVLALAIEHTRGFCWNWTLHVVADVAIFATLVAIGIDDSRS
jgi:Type II CAAX prenyl endopeptidase Rce1-like